MSTYITDDHDLIEVIHSAAEEDLGILADFITDNNKGRISLDNAVRVQMDTFKRMGKLTENSDLLIKEIQEFGGNSIINFFRGKGVSYREIVVDVADHMKAKFDKSDSVETIELKILLAVVEKSMEKMSPEEQREFFEKVSGGKVMGIGPMAMAALQTIILAGGFSSYMLATTVANAVAKQLIGRGLGFAAAGGLMRIIAQFAGPIGWALTAIWSAFDLASPAYRVTVPCVVQIAFMRQRAKEHGALLFCEKCNAIVAPEQRSSCLKCHEGEAS